MRPGRTRARLVRACIIATVGAAACLTAATGGARGAAAAPRTAAAAAPIHAAAPAGNTASPIQHIVILFQENHSFDNVLGAYCAANTRAAPCDGATSGKLPDGSSIPLAKSPDVVPPGDYGPTTQINDIDGGKMDGWPKGMYCGAPGYGCYVQYLPSQIPNMVALANAFEVSDRTFELSPVTSWGGHIELVSPTPDGFSTNPFYNSKQTPPPPPSGQGWGCDSNWDALWKATPSSLPVAMPSCIPDYNLSPTTYPHGGAYRATQVPHVDTLMDRLSSAGLSWKIYTTAAYGWAICPTFADCLYTTQKKGMANVTTFINDAQHGTLPSFSILLPQGASGHSSQHNGQSMATGDNWIGQALSYLQSGPEWSSTAVFISYDDPGGFYDHVAPSVPGAGLRLPMVIASPWVKSCGSTDSNPATPASLMAFTEHTFGLAPLGAADGSAYDYSSAFNFTAPHSCVARFTQTAIPPEEQQYLDAHPGNPDDGT